MQKLESNWNTLWEKAWNNPQNELCKSWNSASVCKSCNSRRELSNLLLLPCPLLSQSLFRPRSLFQRASTIYLQKSASIQPRTSLPKLGDNILGYGVSTPLPVPQGSTGQVNPAQVSPQAAERRKLRTSLHEEENDRRQVAAQARAGQRRAEEALAGRYQRASQGV